MKTKIIISLLVFLGSYTTSTFAQNIQISNTGNPTEPSIIIDPNNTDILIAGANINNYYTSTDAGQTWGIHNLSSSYGVWGDTSLDVDSDGNFYFFHLSNPSNGNWIDRIVCQKSTDNGVSWNDGSYTGLNGTKAQDKQWSVIDYNNGNIYLTWTQFDDYGSDSPSDKSNIMFSKSTDSGVSWSIAKKINLIDGDCLDESDTVEGATPAVGPNGEIYVTWMGPNGLVFTKSLDQGETWLEEEIVIDPLLVAGWDYTVPGIWRANGLAIIKCDLSGGENHGTIYVNWSDQRNGINDTDIWFSKSIDGGNTWTSARKVNNDGVGNQQFFTWMDIDQTNGNLFFVFYDRRNYDNELTDVYMASSINGGESFINKKISESPFLPNTNVFFGDYTNITAHNNIVRPIWTRLHNGELSVWTNIAPLEDLLIGTDDFDTATANKITQFPNPATNKTYVSFKLHEISRISLQLHNLQGKAIHTIIDNTDMEYGKYIIPIELDKLNLASGTYYFTLIINGKSKTLKNIVIN